MHDMPNVLSMHLASYDCIDLLQKLPGLQQTEKVLAYKKGSSCIVVGKKIKQLHRKAVV